MDINDINNESEPLADSAEDDTQSLQEQLKKCQADLADYLSGWQRARADHINYKNEEARRLEDTARHVVASFIQDMLPVLDSFDLALKAYHPSASSGQALPAEEHGILLIRSQLLDALTKRGLHPIQVHPGDAFDPDRHEALMEVDSEFPAGTIVEEIQKGYTLRDRTIRPARVSVSKEKN